MLPMGAPDNPCKVQRSWRTSKPDTRAGTSNAPGCPKVSVLRVSYRVCSGSGPPACCRHSDMGYMRGRRGILKPLHSFQWRSKKTFFPQQAIKVFFDPQKMAILGHCMATTSREHLSDVVALILSTVSAFRRCRRGKVFFDLKKVFFDLNTNTPERFFPNSWYNLGF